MKPFRSLRQRSSESQANCENGAARAVGGPIVFRPGCAAAPCRCATGAGPAAADSVRPCTSLFAHAPSCLTSEKENNRRSEAKSGGCFIWFFEGFFASILPLKIPKRNKNKKNPPFRANFLKKTGFFSGILLTLKRCCDKISKPIMRNYAPRGNSLYKHISMRRANCQEIFCKFPVGAGRGSGPARAANLKNGVIGSDG